VLLAKQIILTTLVIVYIFKALAAGLQISGARSAALIEISPPEIQTRSKVGEKLRARR
jgi:hypothetical protein